MNNKHNHQESGFAMVGVLIIFIIITVLGLSIVTLSFASVKTSTNERDNQSAYYIAEAGLAYQIEKVKNDALTFYENESVRTEEDFSDKLTKLVKDDIKYEEFDKVNGIQPFAEISVDLKGETENQFIIESTGVIGEQERTVSSSFSVRWKDKYKEEEGSKYGELPPVAVLTTGKIDITGGLVKGSIATHSKDQGSIKFDWGKIEDNNSERSEIFVHKNASISNIIEKPDYRTNIPTPKSRDDLWELPQLPEFEPFPDLPDAKEKVLDIRGGQANDREYKIEQSQRFDKIKVLDDRKLTFDVGDIDKEIVVDDFIIEQGHVVLNGTGKLTIYVRENIRFGGEWGGGDSTVNNNGDPNRLNIFVKGADTPKTLSVTDNQVVYGSIFAENANIDLVGSGSIVGNVFTNGKTIKISGAGKNISQLILAPNADVIMEGSASITGMVISNTYSHPGDATIIHDQPLIINGPISIDSLYKNSDEGSGSTNLVPTGAIPDISPPTPPREK